MAGEHGEGSIPEQRAIDGSSEDNDLIDPKANF